MDHIAEILAPAEHPCYKGHFPGNPVVPGVLLLELLTEAFGRGAPRAVSSVKFHRALAPADRCTLHWKNRGASLSFRCERASELVAEGSLEYGPND
jgi:3-hydroxyacyl-[acyl-carrier-protein] dehydratase